MDSHQQRLLLSMRFKKYRKVVLGVIAVCLVLLMGDTDYLQEL